MNQPELDWTQCRAVSPYGRQCGRDALLKGRLPLCWQHKEMARKDAEEEEERLRQWRREIGIKSS